jgi:hypothetical protein
MGSRTNRRHVVYGAAKRPTHPLHRARYPKVRELDRGYISCLFRFQEHWRSPLTYGLCLEPLMTLTIRRLEVSMQRYAAPIIRTVQVR